MQLMRPIKKFQEFQIFIINIKTNGESGQNCFFLSLPPTEVLT